MASDNLVSVTINDKSLRRSLRALDLAATDMEPAMRKIAGTLLAETQFNFLDEGVRGGCPRWQRKNVTDRHCRIPGV